LVSSEIKPIGLAVINSDGFIYRETTLSFLVMINF